MMQEVFVATPLNSGVWERPYKFAEGVSIRKLGGPIRWDLTPTKRYFSEQECDELAKTGYWLCVDGKCEHPFDESGQQLYYDALRATWALQLIHPSSEKRLFLALREIGGEFDCLGSSRWQESARSYGLAPLLCLDTQEFTEKRFDSLYAGIRRAGDKNIVRLWNPILLLEHGLRIGESNLSALMLTMGLDTLFMAGGKKPFISRVGGFLGLDTLVFPPGVTARPTTRVRDVLEDIFKLRNEVAHGREIPAKFRAPTNVQGTNGEILIEDSDSDNYRYSDLMFDSSRFLLVAALRKIILDGLVDDLANANRWKAKLRAYEQAYKSAGGS